MQLNLVIIGSNQFDEKLKKVHKSLSIKNYVDFNQFLNRRMSAGPVTGFLLTSKLDPLAIAEIRELYPSAGIIAFCHDDEQNFAEQALKSGADDIVFASMNEPDNLNRIFIRLMHTKKSGVRLAWTKSSDNESTETTDFHPNADSELSATI